MNDIEGRKARYLRDGLPIRMGGLAANLARVSSFSKIDKAKAAVVGLIVESEHFIEWTALEYDLPTTIELLDIQRVLARWNLTIDSIWSDSAKRKSVGSEAQEISERLLSKTGLLDQ